MVLQWLTIPPKLEFEEQGGHVEEHVCEAHF